MLIILQVSTNVQGLINMHIRPNYITRLLGLTSTLYLANQVGLPILLGPNFLLDLANLQGLTSIPARPNQLAYQAKPAQRA